MELDKNRNEMALNNAEVYGVDEYINFVTEDVMKADFEKGEEPDLVFLSPPWGGTEYANESYYSLFSQISPNIYQVLQRAVAFAPRLCIHLPRNTIVTELIVMFSMLQQDCRERGINLSPAIEVEKIFIGNNLKCIQVYFGDLQDVRLAHIAERGHPARRSHRVPDRRPDADFR